MKALNGSGRLHLPKGTYELTEPLNCRNMRGLVIEGDGPGTVIRARFPRGKDHPARKWPVVDLTGSNLVTIRNLTISTPYDPEMSAGCGILEAREKGESAGFHVLDSLVLEGFFEGAALWNAASECNSYRSCLFINYLHPSGPLDGGYAVFIGNGPAAGEDPDTTRTIYRKIKCHPSACTPERPAGHVSQTMLQLTFQDCFLADYSKAKRGQSVLALIHGNHRMALGDIHWIGGGTSLGSEDFARRDRGGFAAFYIHLQGSRGQVMDLHWQGLRNETTGARHWLYINSDLEGRGAVNLTVRNCNIQSLESAIRCDTTTRNGPWVVESNTVTNYARYDWGDVRPVYQAVRSLGMRWDRNNLLSLTTDPKGGQCNLVYKVDAWSQDETVTATKEQVKVGAGAGLTIHDQSARDSKPNSPTPAEASRGLSPVEAPAP